MSLNLSIGTLLERARSSFTKLFSNATGDLIGGLSSSVIGVAYGLTFATLIFSGPLKPWSGYGLSATFVTMAICAAVMAARSSLPVVIAGPDGATAAITASLVGALIAALEDIGLPDDLLAPTMILIAFSTAATGVVLWAIAALRVSNAIRYIPYPVIGGFLAATGWLMISGGLRIVLDRTAGAWIVSDTHAATLKFLTAIGMGLAIALVQRIWKSPYALPVTVLGGVAAGNFGLLIMGVGLVEADANGWFVHPPRAELFQTWDFDDLKMFPWTSLSGLGGDILGMMFVTAITMLLNTNGLELVTQQEADLEQELKTIGFANVISAACGGYVGCTSLSRSSLNHAVGATGRLSGFIVALISGAILFSGTGFVAYAPKFVLGGLMLNLGGGTMKKWLVDTLPLLSRQEYAVLLAVTFVIIQWGFIAGVLAGVLISCMTFAYGASQTEAVKFRFDGAEYGSSLDRSSEELTILAAHRDEIQGFVLQSYLFFGSANRLYENIKALLAQNAACRFLIFDFTLVHGLDSSALHSFRQIKKICSTRDVRLALVNVSVAMRPSLAEVITETDIIGESLDHALESCEHDVIARHLQSDDDESDLSTWLVEEFGCPRIAERLAGHCIRQEVPAGELIAVQGERASSMHFILKGRLAVIVGLDKGTQTRVRSLGRHTTVGEMGLLTGGLRSATVRAETDSVVYRLDEAVFATVKREDPELAQALLTYVLTVMAQRLRMTSNVVAVLRR